MTEQNKSEIRIGTLLDESEVFVHVVIMLIARKGWYKNAFVGYNWAKIGAAENVCPWKYLNLKFNVFNKK